MGGTSGRWVRRRDGTPVRAQSVIDRALLNYTSVGLMVFDRAGAIVEVIPAYPKVPGYDAAQVMSAFPGSLIHPDDLDRWQRAWARVVAEPEHTETVVVRTRHLGDPEHPVEATLVNALDDPGVRGIVATLVRLPHTFEGVGGGGGAAPLDSPAVDSSAESRLDPEVLAQALADDEFLLQYQPVVDLATGGLVGVEALMRWARAGQPLIAPGAYLEMAERTGIILPLGAWVLREACRCAVGWKYRTGTAPYVAVNLAACQLEDPELVPTVKAAVADSTLEPARLTLEITEGVLVRDLKSATTRLQELRDLGVRVAVDDFGMGYSSLSYLRRLPVDILKIDRFFVSGLGQEDGDRAIVAAIITLARSLGFDVVAEGVETLVQAEELIRLGCANAQGFLFGRPGPADALVFDSPIPLASWRGTSGPGAIERLPA